jgi:pimeloyl-ACP methyl ester carboxylesterase
MTDPDKRASSTCDKLLFYRHPCVAMAPHSASHSSGKPGAWSDPATHKSSFVMANGIRLHYLDWGGNGPVLILIHGYGDNPHYFDDLAPAFTDRFRVVAYARRGHGQSDAKGPYDTATLTEDLRGLMDGLGIAKAYLVGHSMGGNEITAMAGTHPERVGRIVYLDGGYDFADPAFVEAFKSLPPIYLGPPASALTSIDAYKAYQASVWWPGMSDPRRYEAYAREMVVIQSDGSVRPRMSESAAQALANTLLSERRDYTKVRSPALAIYATTLFDVHNGDSAQIAQNLELEQKHLTSFRTSSIERVRRELPNAEIVNVPGTHVDFFFTSREQVVAAMRRFLRGP